MRRISTWRAGRSRRPTLVAGGSRPSWRDREPALHTVASTTLVIAAFLVVISAVQPFAGRLHVPFTVLLACVGVLVGGISSFLVSNSRLAPVLDIAGPLADFPISAQVFLTVFLPLLLFHAALTIDLR